MRKLIFIPAGILGLVVAWASLQLVEFITWPASPTPTYGCFSISDCAHNWWAAPLLLLALLGPAMAYMILSAIGLAKDWKRRQWLANCGIALLATLAIYVANDALWVYSGWAK